MPIISMFTELSFRMYFAPKEHPPPHFHVYYGDHKATIDICTCEVIQGNLPRKQTKTCVGVSRTSRRCSRREKAARLSAALGDPDGAKYEKAQFCACACDAVGE